MRFKPSSAIGACASATCLLAMFIVAMVVAFPASAQASFGVKKFDLAFPNVDGSPVTQAGSHPFAVTNVLDFNTAIDPGYGEVPDGAVKDLEVQLPEGLIGDPGAVPRCSSADFINFNAETKIPSCSNSSAVGVINLRLLFNLGDPVFISAPVYNLFPPPGVVQKLGFIAYGVPVTLEFTLNPNPPYNVVVSLQDIAQPLPVLDSVLTIWGDPASPLHDSERGSCIKDDPVPEEGIHTTGESCPADVAEAPFVTLPTSCAGPLTTSYEADSWQEPGAFVKGSVETHDSSTPPEPLGLSGCSKLNFSPTIAAAPTSVAAQSPTGLDFSLNVHDEGLTSPTGLSQADIKKAVVTLPEGMTANPSLAEGLGVCTEEDLARETVNSAPGEGCPNESKIGTVEVETPIVEEPLKGSLFIAKPYANPFNSLLAMYFVFRNPTLGVIIKQPAHIEPNPVTGQLVTVVENIPQLPFSHFTLHFREGARSPLVTPAACGTYNATAELTPWSGGAPVTTSSAFQIIAGTNAGPCPAGGVPPFAPQVTTGTLNNSAGSYSQFDLRIGRNDGEQELTRFSTTLPPGLTGNLTGIPFCPDGAIEAARNVTGTQETSSPSCPAASEIGHTIVGAGVGPTLAQTPGKIYLAGPYHGAPLSIVSITSATVGPFDLGTVVIRFALQINPTTAQVEISAAGSDPIPHIIDGIVVNVREIHAYIDREKFILNPTSCAPMSIQNTISGAGADFTNPADQVPVLVSSPFQAADCSSLKFTPKFAVSTSGKTSKANGASLSVKLSFPSGSLGTQANIAKVKVDLPKQLPSRLTTLQKACTAAQFSANPAGCPAASVVGYAKAITPLIPVPLEGPAYFVSHGGEAFPSLIMVLQGYGIKIDLVGSTFISKTGITSSTFKAVPDQPVTSFELTLPEGKYSALAANGNLCTSKLTTPSEFTGQNGTMSTQNTPVTVTGCPTTLSFKQMIKKRTLSLAVYAPAAGRVTAAGQGLTSKITTAKGQGPLTITLKQKKAGKLKTTIKITYTPSTGRDRKKQTKSAKLRFKQ
jgi:hypothetical protein